MMVLNTFISGIWLLTGKANAETREIVDVNIVKVAGKNLSYGAGVPVMIDWEGKR